MSAGDFLRIVKPVWSPIWRFIKRGIDQDGAHIRRIREMTDATLDAARATRDIHLMESAGELTAAEGNAFRDRIANLHQLSPTTPTVVTSSAPMLALPTARATRTELQEDAE